MGHGTSRAAMVCLHSTDERQRKVADALGDMVRAELQDDRKRASARSESGAQGSKGQKMIRASDGRMGCDLEIRMGAPSAIR
jgi:hypothetical protein